MVMKNIGLIFSAALIGGAMLISAAPASAKEKAADNYKLYCVQCHGTKGIGRGINAPALSVQPRNHVSATDMGQLTDDSVFKAIKEGGVAVGKSTQMPPFGAILSDDEVKEMVAHLRGMCKCEGKK